jgi:hypothetical protein
VRDFGAPVLAHDVKAEVERRRAPRRTQDLTIIDVQHIGQELDRGTDSFFARVPTTTAARSRPGHGRGHLPLDTKVRTCEGVGARGGPKSVVKSETTKPRHGGAGGGAAGSCDYRSFNAIRSVVD